MGGVAQAGASVAVPALQAAATLRILKEQRSYYKEIASERISLINTAVRNYTNTIQAMVTTGQFRTAYGSTPKAGRYTAVDFQEELYEASNQNLNNMPIAEREIAAATYVQKQIDLSRIAISDPNYLAGTKLRSIQIKAMLEGRIGVDTTLQITTDQAELDALNGRIGTSMRLTHVNLGIARRQLEEQGRQEQDEFILSQNQVSNPGQFRSINDVLQNPANRIAFAIQQAQLIQADLQNVENVEAAGDPAAFGQLQVELSSAVNVLSNEAQRGNLINQFAPDLGSLLAPSVNSISEALLAGNYTGQRGGDTPGAATSNRESRSIGAPSGRRSSSNSVSRFNNSRAPITRAKQDENVEERDF